jgi:hypothetical protein
MKENKKKGALLPTALKKGGHLRLDRSTQLLMMSGDQIEIDGILCARSVRVASTLALL